jgi:hypothetical protein
VLLTLTSAKGSNGINFIGLKRPISRLRIKPLQAILQNGSPLKLLVFYRPLQINVQTLA